MLRDGLIHHLKMKGVDARFHYQALHRSKAGLKYGRTHSSCEVSVRISETLLRLPLWNGMDDVDIDRVIDGCLSYSIR